MVPSEIEIKNLAYVARNLDEINVIYMSQPTSLSQPTVLMRK